MFSCSGAGYLSPGFVLQFCSERLCCELGGLQAWVTAELSGAGWFGVWHVGCVVDVGPVGFDWRYCLVCGAVAALGVWLDRTR